MALLEHTFSADGNSSSVAYQAGSNDFHGSMGIDPTANNFGSGTLTLQWSEDDSTWLTTSYTRDTSNAEMLTFDLPSGFVRLNLSGSTTPNLKAYVIPH